MHYKLFACHTFYDGLYHYVKHIFDTHLRPYAKQPCPLTEDAESALLREYLAHLCTTQLSSEVAMPSAEAPLTAYSPLNSSENYDEVFTSNAVYLCPFCLDVFFGNKCFQHHLQINCLSVSNSFLLGANLRIS